MNATPSPLSTYIALFCDRCGEMLFGDISNVRALFEATGWREIGGFHICPSCVGAKAGTRPRDTSEPLHGLLMANRCARSLASDDPTNLIYFAGWMSSFVEFWEPS